ncbi:hypothetical protein [Magnetovibrio sp.]|uniref:hypothetical protein n=1 Tax=Magnetovibrio sp. TaxID=2024836 RepID=UPI002F930849
MSIETQIITTAFVLFSIVGAAAISMGTLVKSNWLLFATWAFLVSALMILTSFAVGSWIWAIAFAVAMFAAIAAITYLVVKKGA